LRAASYSSATNYSPQSLWVVTDEAAAALSQAIQEVKHAYVLKLHPDKNSQITAIANAGYQQLQRLQEKASRLLSIWQRGQWISTAAPTALHLTDGQHVIPRGIEPLNEDSIHLNWVEPPETPLTLSVLTLKSQYSRRIQTNNNLNKYTPAHTTALENELYAGPNNTCVRESWQFAQTMRTALKAQQQAQKAQLAQVKREKEAERQRADAERKRGDAEQQRADAERKRGDAERQRADAAQQREEAEKKGREEEQHRADNAEGMLLELLSKPLEEEFIIAVKAMSPKSVAAMQAVFEQVVDAIQSKADYRFVRPCFLTWQAGDYAKALSNIILNKEAFKDLRAYLPSVEQSVRTTSAQSTNYHGFFDPLVFTNQLERHVRIHQSLS
jgi:hypothetical protein